MAQDAKWQDPPGVTNEIVCMNGLMSLKRFKLFIRLIKYTSYNHTIYYIVI